MDVLVDPDFRDSQFARQTHSPFFVDKTELLGEVFTAVDQYDCYQCVSRPRRFGKSLAASMIASFFGPKDSSELFDRMLIAQHPDYQRFLNAYHVIYLSLIPNDLTAGVTGLLAELEADLLQQLKKAFPEVPVLEHQDVFSYLAKIFRRTRAKFVFVVDEWDAILHDDEVADDDRKTYLCFFNALLKNQPYVAFAYLTGIWPTFQLSHAGELNMFDDYTVADDRKFGRFFGFTEAEVDRLFQVYVDSTAKPRISRADLDLWYGGYSTACGGRVFNPWAVDKALTHNKLASYWGDSGPLFEVFEFARFGMAEVREDFEKLLVGGGVWVDVDERCVIRRRWVSRKEIFSAMVVYGLLTAEPRSGAGLVDLWVLRIPNRDVLRKFLLSVEHRPVFGRAYELVRLSDQFLLAFDGRRADEVARVVQEIHAVVSPVKDSDLELELACVLDWALLGVAQSVYYGKRELDAGDGFADFALVPGGVSSIPLYIFGFGFASCPQVILERIKSCNYAASFEWMSRLKGGIVAVGISYDPADPSKTHSCEIEVLRDAV